MSNRFGGIAGSFQGNIYHWVHRGIPSWVTELNNPARLTSYCLTVSCNC
jgi:hypothetical protein